jgi:cell division protein FtsN
MAKRNTRRSTYQRRSTQRQRAAVSPIKWLLSGILIGLIVPSYFLLKSKDNPTSLSAAESSEVVSNQSVALKEHVTKKIHPKEKQAQSSTHSNYEFYNLLSEEDPGSKTKKNTDSQAVSFTLRISSFKTYAEADQLKAQLSLIGVDQINISKTSPYKVVAGPYSSKSDALKIKKQLEENDIAAELVKAISE